MRGTGLTAGADELAGRIAGAVLAAIRTETGRTQQDLAEQMRVGLSTVQAWESGRRPLIKASFQDLQRLNRQLRVDGAPVGLLHLLEQALLVDSIYTDMSATESRSHPLALLVPDRALTELLTWPLTGETPQQLRATKVRLYVPTGVRDAVATELRRAADSSPRDERGAMMRRQVKFLVAGNSASAEWVRAQAAEDVRAHVDLRTWSPNWPVARSQAVSSAQEGDPEPLRQFIERGLADDATMTANLTYWAYWVGEHAAPWTQDADMVDPSQDWAGDRLLDSLVQGVARAPYRELCIHSLWALLRRRGRLLRRPAAAERVRKAAELALDTETLEIGTRQRLEQVRYLAESAG